MSIEGALLPGKTAKDNWLALDYERLLLSVGVQPRAGGNRKILPMEDSTGSYPVLLTKTRQNA